MSKVQNRDESHQVFQVRMGDPACEPDAATIESLSSITLYGLAIGPANGATYPQWERLSIAAAKLIGIGVGSAEVAAWFTASMRRHFFVYARHAVAARNVEWGADDRFRLDASVTRLVWPDGSFAYDRDGDGRNDVAEGA